MDRIAVVALAVITAVAALIVPTLRFRLRTGKWPFSVHARTPAHRRMKHALTASSIGYFAIIVTYGVLGPHALGVLTTPRTLYAAGWAFACGGLIVVVVAQTQMGLAWRMGIVEDRTELVTRGLYNVVRNPIFAGMLCTLFGMLLIVPSAWTLAGFVLVLVLLALEARYEERHLLALHGDPYRRYAARVGRFVPYVGRLSPITP